MIKAVVFDFDGVIGDTMSDNCRAWKEAFAPYAQITDIDYYVLEGMGRFQIAEYLVKQYNLNRDIEPLLVEAKEANYSMNNSFRIFEGVFEIFDQLAKKNIKMAIATGASRSRLDATLDSHLLHQLSTTITADDVSQHKPHPEPYLKAVNKLNISPDECLVIENAILGIASAKAAGCICYAIETTLGKEYLAKADAIFDNHQALLLKLKDLPIVPSTN